MNKTVYLSAFVLICALRIGLDSTGSGPNVEDLTLIHCPTGEPFKCVPHGICYNYDHYCSDASKNPESCFPSELDVPSLRSWCQDVQRSPSLLLNPQCKYACQEKFPESSCSNATLYVVTTIAVLLFITVVFLIVYIMKLKKIHCPWTFHPKLERTQQISTGASTGPAQQPARTENAQNERTENSLASHELMRVRREGNSNSDYNQTNSTVVNHPPVDCPRPDNERPETSQDKPLLDENFDIFLSNPSTGNS